MKPNYSSEDFQRLLDRHLQGRTTPEEDELIIEWFESLGKEEPVIIENEGQLKNEIWNGISSQKDKSNKQRFILSYSTALRIAASLLIIIAAGIFLFLNNKSNSSNESLAESALEWHDISNPGKQTLKVDLPDGSKVLLGTNAVLSTSEMTKGGQRVVRLKGEAFFDVAHDPSRPFIVYSQDIVTRVLGTKFIIRAPGPGKQVLVIVNSGKVAVSHPNKKAEVILTPDQKVVYDPSEGSFIQKTVVKKDTEQTIHSFPMQFDEEPVSHILELLKKEYKVEIEYDEHLLKDCLVTTAFSEEGLFQRLTIISKIIGATYTTEDGKIIFKSAGC